MTDSNYDFFGQHSYRLDITTKHFPSDFFKMLPYAIPSRPGNCPTAPLIMVVRRLTNIDILKVARKWEIQSDLFPDLVVPSVKDCYLKKDIELLVMMVENYYHMKLKEFGINPLDISDNLLQIIEIDVTMKDLYPGDTEIHYSIHTKRELRILDDDTTD